MAPKMFIFGVRGNLVKLQPDGPTAEANGLLSQLEKVTVRLKNEGGKLAVKSENFSTTLPMFFIKKRDEQLKCIHHKEIYGV